MRVAIDVNTTALRTLSTDIRRGVGVGMKSAAAVASDRVRLTFEAEGNRDGMDAWDPTTAIALLNRVNPVTHGPGGSMGQWKTMTDTGALKASVSGELVNDARDFVEYEVRHRTPYGDVLDQGGTATFDGESHTIPPRPFLDLVDPVDVDLLESAIDAALEAVL